MCGIFGSFGTSLSVETLRKVREKIQHRGPDDFHEISFDNKFIFTCAAVRLAFQDEINGRQPFASNEDLDLVVSLNGEIFNYKELKEKFYNTVYSLGTHCDTELLIPLYMDEGIDSIRKINGMYALSIVDRTNSSAYLATDFLGQKPIFYYFSNNILFYASEIEPLLELIKSTLGEDSLPKINEKALTNIVLYKSTVDGETVYEGIKRLKPGEIIKYDFAKGSLTSSFYDNFERKYSISSVQSEEKVISNINELLREAVRRRIDSSKPQSVYLSGGLDSSLITSIIRDLYPKLEIHSFTLAYKGIKEAKGKSLDLKLAKEVSSRNSLVHHIINIDPADLDSFMPTILKGFGEPFASVPSMWFVANEIKKYSKYTLSGDGADELFGSYFTHREATKSNVFSTKNAQDLHAEYMLSFLPSHMQNNMKFKNLKNKTLKVEKLIEKINTTMEKRNPIFNQLIFESRMLFPYGVLTYIDRLSMSHSIEPRSPFLDKDLWEYVYTLDDNYRIRNNQTKYALKKVAESYLPFELIYRKKEGFVFPLYPYLIKSKVEIISRILRLNDIFKDFEDGWLNIEWLEAAFSEIERSKGLAFKTSQIIHSLNSIAIWAKNRK